MSIVSLLIVFVLTVLLQQWLHRHIQGLALAMTGNAGCGLRFLFYMLLPGIVLHEASHYVFARLLFVRTGGVNVGIGERRTKKVSLGSVDIARVDPVRESLIGVAPFIVGITAIWLLTGWGIGMWPDALVPWEQVVERFAARTSDWTIWLDLYLIFAVSTAMIPSESDREPWGPVVSIIGLGVAILFIMGWTPRVPPEWVALARRWLDALTYALGVAVIVNGLMAVVLWAMERLWENMSGRRIEYRLRR